MKALLEHPVRTPVLQQPEWPDPAHVTHVRDRLARLPALVRLDDVHRLHRLLAEVASGRMLVVQAGDCAEDPAECAAGPITRKAALLDVLAGVLTAVSGKAVLKVGRIAGQFAKPRSRPTEWVDGVELAVYRGHMVNGPEPQAALRVPDPRRLVEGYQAASRAMAHLGWGGSAARSTVRPTTWTSHEALLLDYEVPLLRQQEGAGTLVGSTHWPWIGERTGDVDGAHVALLADAVNPVACKVGPGMSVDRLLALAERLDPGHEPGRLTLIARMGAGVVREKLPPLVRALKNAGHPVIWLTDPMHGNTVTTATGFKTRLLDTVVREVREFHAAVRSAGSVAGGLHLETTPHDVNECAVDEASVEQVGDPYTSFCDPRLNLRQAVSVALAWQA